MQEIQETRVDPWVGKIPWRREWQPTPVILAWKTPTDRGNWWYYSPWGHTESDKTEHTGPPTTSNYTTSQTSSCIRKCLNLCWKWYRYIDSEAEEIATNTVNWRIDSGFFGTWERSIPGSFLRTATRGLNNGGCVDCMSVLQYDKMSREKEHRQRSECYLVTLSLLHHHHFCLTDL